MFNLDPNIDTLDAIIREEIIHYTSNYNLNTDILSLNSSPTLFIFFDGLDELPADQVSLALNCMQRIRFLYPTSRMHITTRPNLMHRLESSLCTLGYTIERFDRPYQVKFLTEHWSRIRLTEPRLLYEKLKEFGENCLSTLKNVITSDEEDFAGIPLQCYLLAECFKDEAMEFGDPEDSLLVGKAPPRIQVKSITQLYELVVQQKFQIFKARHMNTYSRPISEPTLQKIHTYISIEVVMKGTNWHSKLRTTFLDKDSFADLKRTKPKWDVTFSQFQNGQLPREDLLAVGILEEIDIGCWKFVHRTFAEYFIARFGSEIINQSQLNYKAFSPNMREFFQEAVLATTEAGIVISDKFNISLDSHKFKYPVVCHFLNTWSHPSLQNKHKISLRGDCYERILQACINARHETLLQYFFQNQVSQDDAKATDLLMLAANCSSVEFFERIRLNFNTDKKHQALILQIAVERGNASLVSYLLNVYATNNSMGDLKLAQSNDLVPLCVTDTTNVCADTLNGKIKILCKLQNHNLSLLTAQNQNNIAPFLQPNIHIKLLNKLVQYSNSDSILGDKDQDFRTILHLGSKYLTAEDYTELVKSIETLHSGALSSLVHYQDVFGITSLHLFIAHHDVLPIELLSIFKEHGADLSTTDETGYNVLWTAIRHNRSMENIKCLLQYHPSNEDTNDEFHRTTLHIATQHYRNKSLLELLVGQGYNVDLEDKYGNTPLFYALRNQNDSSSNSHIRFLYSKNANILHTNKNEETLIHVSAQLGKVKSIELLLQLGFKLKSTSICLRDKYGNTPLHHALKSRSGSKCAVVRLLVDQFPSDVNQPNKKGQCPLHCALSNRNVDLSIDTLELLEPKITEWPVELINELVAFSQRFKEEHKENAVRCEHLMTRLTNKQVT